MRICATLSESVHVCSLTSVCAYFWLLSIFNSSESAWGCWLCCVESMRCVYLCANEHCYAPIINCCCLFLLAVVRICVWVKFSEDPTPRNVLLNSSKKREKEICLRLDVLYSNWEFNQLWLIKRTPQIRCAHFCVHESLVLIAKTYVFCKCNYTKRRIIITENRKINKRNWHNFYWKRRKKHFSSKYIYRAIKAREMNHTCCRMRKNWTTTKWRSLNRYALTKMNLFSPSIAFQFALQTTDVRTYVILPARTLQCQRLPDTRLCFGTNNLSASDFSCCLWMFDSVRCFSRLSFTFSLWCPTRREDM